MPMFRHKSIVIEAVQWTDDDPAWSAVCGLHADSELDAFREANGTVSIETVGGRAYAEPGDWIIKLNSDAFSICRQDNFSADYEPM